jgi:hypothetical protein
MVDNLTGPALRGVPERWAPYPQEDLYSWIRSSQQLLEAGHPRALELWEKWKPAIMNDFPELTDEQIAQLLVFIEG